MTKLYLLCNIIIVSTILLLLLIIALVTKYYFQYDLIYDALKDFYSVFIAIAAAYIGYCFQRRHVFMASLRDLWKELTETKADISIFMCKTRREEGDSQILFRNLSISIDLVRCVYKNVKESEKDIGLYPFEPLHDIRRSLEKWRNNGFSDKHLDETKESIDNAWQAIRWAFLAELPRPSPARPITKHNAVDPRRKK